ncbi:MAG TPA: CARDB domain-containing protein, partial [Methylocella sp.]
MIKFASFSIAAALLAFGLFTCPAAAGPNLPDLIVTNISTSPANPTSGQAVTFTATVMNQGIAATPSGVSIGVNFFVDGNPVSTSDNNIISLAPGASVTLTANLGPGGGAGLSTWLASAGSHTVLAVVDPRNRITESSKSNNSLSITITVTLTPPAFVIGDRVQTTANLNVYATASTSGTILGQQAVGSLGTVIGGPITANNFVWWNINYDIGADGWSIQDYLAKASPLPTVSLTANPTSITSGGSSTLTWSSTNATSCTVTGFTAGGTSGTVTVSPTVSQSYSVTCTGA